MDKKYVYLFNEGNSEMKELLGGKGANLAEMTNLRITSPSEVLQLQQRHATIIMITAKKFLKK